jgi:hypothetical protein
VHVREQGQIMLTHATPKMLHVIGELAKTRPMLEQLDRLQGDEYRRLDDEYRCLTEPLWSSRPAR